MQASEIREMEQADILTRINELEEERFRLKFRGATENLEDPLRLRLIRRDVARLKTVLSERELGAAPAAPAAGGKSTARKAAATKAVAKKGAAKKGAAKKAAAKKSAPKAKAGTSSAREGARTAAPKARKQER